MSLPLTAAEFRTMLNAYSDVPDAIIEQAIRAALEWAEAEAGTPLYPRSEKLMRWSAPLSREYMLVLGDRNAELVEVRVNGVTVEPVPHGSATYRLYLREGDAVEVRWRAGFEVAPDGLKHVLAERAALELETTGYARNESWLGLEQVGIQTADGTRNLKRVNVEEYFRRRLLPYSRTFETCLL